MTASSKLNRLAQSYGANLTKQELAARLNCSVRTLERKVAEGVIPPPDVQLSKRLIRWRPHTVAHLIPLA